MVVILLAVVALSGNDNKVFKKNTNYNTRTIMVYMVGSNLESECKAATGDMDFVNPSTIDLNTTNILIYTGGTKWWHNQVRNDENAIYKLTENGFEKIETYWKNPYQTMLNWGKTASTRQKETPSPAIARTWITAYDTPYWNPTVTYDGKMLSQQIQGLYDAGLSGGYMTWNSGSNLTKYKTQASAFSKLYVANKEG